LSHRNPEYSIDANSIFISLQRSAFFFREKQLQQTKSSLKLHKDRVEDGESKEGWITGLAEAEGQLAGFSNFGPWPAARTRSGGGLDFDDGSQRLL